MFRITRAQMYALRQATIDRFVEEMATHLRETFPEQYHVLGDDGLRDTVQYGIERARIHAITSERDLCLYLGLMLTFGRDFDREQPWAREILESSLLEPADVVVERLHAAGMEREP
ncbi:hypothetical protein [Archangium sp.]|uniref:hypothetical protein n=1 Tax=Archangium sp. TaxID=1872627 RepID=UPI002D327A81|nr:hypothetical protein [Archangium sp.]HYO52803.1 hypothetical protein [Archangium sp.]